MPKNKLTDVTTVTCHICMRGTGMRHGIYMVHGSAGTPHCKASGSAVPEEIIKTKEKAGAKKSKDNIIFP